MKITNNFNNLYYTHAKNKTIDEKSSQDNSQTELRSYPATYFCGTNKDNKKTDIEKEKLKLYRNFYKLAQGKISKTELMTEDEFLAYEIKKEEQFEKRKKKQIEKIESMAGILFLSDMLKGKFDRKTLETMFNDVNDLKKRKYEMTSHKNTEEIEENGNKETILLRKFYTSMSDDNYNLRSIFRHHYDELNSLTTIEELQECYPNINVPERPEVSISNRIADTLDNDFYIELNKKLKSNNQEKIEEHYSRGVKNIIAKGMQKSTKEERQFIYDKINDTLKKQVLNKSHEIAHSDKITSAKKKKIPNNLIMEQDKKMLSIDYDKFILSVIKDEYLNFKRPDNISYQEGDTIIRLNELKHTAYKFEKFPEPMKNFLRNADIINQAQRDYDNYTTEELKERLSHNSTQLSNEDDLIESFIIFGTCLFDDDDTEDIKQFLRITDKVLDKDMTGKDAAEYIKENNISPKGTERIRKEEEEQNKLKKQYERKRYLALTHQRAVYSKELELLHANKLSETGLICEKYAPEQIDDPKTKKITEILDKHKDTENPNTYVNKKRLAAEILSFDKYNTEKNKNPDSLTLKKAEEYAKNSDGTIDEEKAGTYIINTEIINSYPNLTREILDKDALDIIMSNYDEDKEDAILCLCKYDEYKALPNNKRDKLKNITDIFTREDKREDKLLKYIVENDYLSIPTSDIAIAKNSGKRAKATIMPEAKKELVNKGYNKRTMYAIDDLLKFEEALQFFAPEKGSAGIKDIGVKNKKNKGTYELKIMGSDDRMLGYKKNNEYIFDKYKEDGLHSKKKK